MQTGSQRQKLTLHMHWQKIALAESEMPCWSKLT
jgi:hypothetical protein